MSLSSVPSPENDSFAHPQVLLSELRKLRRRLPAVHDARQLSQEGKNLLPILAGGDAPQLIEDFSNGWTTLQRWLGFLGTSKACSSLDVPIVNRSVIKSIERWLRDSETILLEFMKKYPGEHIRRVDLGNRGCVTGDLDSCNSRHRDAKKVLQNSSTKVMTAIMDDWVDLPVGQDMSSDERLKVAKISNGVVIVQWKRDDLGGNDWEVINCNPDLDGTDEWTVVEG